MKALCIVAHPDDCIIFGYPFIHFNSFYKWKICYLTYSELSDRGKEIQSFWHRRNIDTNFLGFDDTNEIDYNLAKQKVNSCLEDNDLVLTHNQDGDYGHEHHKLVFQCISNYNNVVTFSKKPHSDVVYQLPKGAYSLQEVPIHAKAICNFHPRIHFYGYKILGNFKIKSRGRNSVGRVQPCQG